MSKIGDRTPAPNAGVPRGRSRRKTDPPAYPTLAPLATRLESLRLQRGYTQRVLAKRAKISTNHYQEVAHARANPTATVLLSLADALGVSLADLFEPSPSPEARRVVFVEDLQDLSAAHHRLTDIIERIAEGDMWRRPRGATRRRGALGG